MSCYVVIICILRDRGGGRLEPKKVAFVKKVALVCNFYNFISYILLHVGTIFKELTYDQMHLLQ